MQQASLTRMLFADRFRKVSCVIFRRPATHNIFPSPSCETLQQNSLSGTRRSPLRILLELRVIEMVVTTGAIRRAKLQLNRHHQQTNTQLLKGQIPFLSPNQQCQSTEGNLQNFNNKTLSTRSFLQCLDNVS